MVLLNAAFDTHRRDAYQGELTELQADGIIILGRDSRWRVARKRSIGNPNREPSPVAARDAMEGSRLLAAPATFRKQAINAPQEAELPENGGNPEPQALLRYYRSALQSDPRGSLTQSDERHGISFQLLAGMGDLFPDEGEEVVVRIRSDDLPGGFREGLSRREGEENGVAIGWPLSVGTQSGAPAIRPVGLLSGRWFRADNAIEVRIEADDVLVNPDWVQATARTTAWTRVALEDLFRGPGSAGLPSTDFLARLREAAARSVRGRLTGRDFMTQLDLDAEGIFDALGLFLPTGSTFTAGAVRDLDVVATWSEKRLASTALAPLLGLSYHADIRSAPPINTGPLNMEQIDAVRQAMAAPLSVVTGPPGTGKSQAIVAMAMTALWNGQRVLVASKNHQALDAVEDRLSEIAPDVHFVVRTLDPVREIDNSMTIVLAELESQLSSFRGPEPEPEVAAELDRRASTRVDALNEIARRRELRLQLAEDIERLEARRIAGIPEGDETDTSSPKIGVWRRFLQWLRLVPKSQSYVGLAGDDTLSTVALRQRINMVQAQMASLGSVPDPVSMTQEIEELAAKVLGRRIGVHSIPSEEQRLKLASARADLELQGESQPDRNVASLILDFRPLWLASVLGTPRRVPLHDRLFDLVIFDEASQCDIASALPLLARAKRAVIVGDDRQLAFIPQLGIAQDRNLMAAQRLPLRGMGRFAQGRKSLFDLARSSPGVPAVMLRDQYRSAADIVAYINHDFYGGKLRVAGDQNALRVPMKSRPGLAWTDVPARGSEDAGSGNVNSAEISAIVTHLEELLLRQDYDGSIGIVSPFRPQVMALSEAVTTRIPEDRRFAADLRIATIDGFQGEERDLILFSPVVNARAAHSAVAFLQKDWRRLNVAISRARAVAHVFGDLSYARSGAIRRLQTLASRATEPRRPPVEEIFDSVWERKLYGALRARKLNPQPQFEIAGRRLDFALFGPGGVSLDVEVDGRRWHQDVDGQRKLDDLWRDHQLRSLGWRVRRFWVDELNEDMESCLDLIERDLA